MAKAFQVLGTTDDVTDCQLCGRTDLKGTIALAPLDTDGNQSGETVYYGSDCGAKAAGWSIKEIRQQAKAADDAKARQAAAARREAQQAESARWRTFLMERTGKSEILEATAALGGFAKARELYRQS